MHEMQILFSWKNDKNISKCLLKTLPRMLSVMVCRNKSRMGLCTVKPVTCTKRRISLHTLSLHISSLIRAFANRMYRLQSMGLTKLLCDGRSDQPAHPHVRGRYNFTQTVLYGGKMSPGTTLRIRVTSYNFA